MSRSNLFIFTFAILMTLPCSAQDQGHGPVDSPAGYDGAPALRGVGNEQATPQSLPVQATSAPLKSKKKRNQSAAGAVVGLPDRAAKTAVGMTDRTAKSEIGLTDRGAKTAVGLSDRAAKTVVGFPLKAAKETLKLLF